MRKVQYRDATKAPRQAYAFSTHAIDFDIADEDLYEIAEGNRLRRLRKAEFGDMDFQGYIEGNCQSLYPVQDAIHKELIWPRSIGKIKADTTQSHSAGVEGLAKEAFA